MYQIQLDGSVIFWLLCRAKLEITNGHKHDHGDHVHDERTEIEQKAVDNEGDDAERSRLTKALVKVRHFLSLSAFGCMLLST